MNRNALLLTNLIMGSAVLASGRGHGGIRPSSERGHTEAHKEESNMLTVFMTGCSAAADWQSLGLYYSFIRSGQPGRIMRIAACRGDDPLERFPSDLVPNWMTEGVWEVEHIVYPLFNKAWAIKQFMELARPPEEYILVLDSDMLIHKQFLPSDFKVAKGTAASENIWYLEDLNTFLGRELLPDLAPKEDWDAYPGVGRVADQVGEFYFLHRNDLERVAALWWEYTLPALKEIQRRAPVLQTSQSLQRRVWYSEMHAYALGAAKEGVHHLASNSSVFHLGYYHPHGAPNALHYAWEAKVPGFDWAFDKHQHKDFKAEKCPPWDLKSRQEGLFPHPPSPSELTSKGGERIRNLLNIEVVATLNMAFCELHHKKLCGDHEQTERECDRAARLMVDLEKAWDEIEAAADRGLTCIDVLPEGECSDTSSPWVPAGQSRGSSSDVDMESLQEYTEYEIRGRAQNNRGASDWSKPIRVLTRRKAVDGGCDDALYRWTQTRGELIIQLAVPVAVKGKDVTVSLKDQRCLDIQVSLGGSWSL
ncbi:hypothetical protein WJX75_007917 [Coccomyxa subellipsoidea]|uniref:Nucleotide-diphospho-sugar transferase domain-containing protein n=1 Tax=Coccomyxa subellipsoidea TaxID=248742 RepID=A0ABR2Z4J4_9CHLO